MALLFSRIDNKGALGFDHQIPARDSWGANLSFRLAGTAGRFDRSFIAPGSVRVVQASSLCGSSIVLSITSWPMPIKFIDIVGYKDTSFIINKFVG